MIKAPPLRVREFNVMLRINGAIESFSLRQRISDWRCCLGGNTSRDGYGKTVEAAIEDCIQSHLPEAHTAGAI